MKPELLKTLKDAAEHHNEQAEVLQKAIEVSRYYLARADANPAFRPNYDASWEETKDYTESLNVWNEKQRDMHAGFAAALKQIIPT